MRALLIEDNTSTGKIIERFVTREGFVVDSTPLGEEGLSMARHYDYDIVLLDLRLPDIDGCEVLRRMRSARIHTPVMIVSGLSSVPIKVRLLNHGADDYMTKPFDKEELMARIQAIIRRSRGFAHGVITIGNISINLDTRLADMEKKPLHLTGKEYSILELLFLRKGRTVTKEMLMNHLYGGFDEPEYKILDAFMSHLRSKIAKAGGEENYIKTIWGKGYRLRDSTSLQSLTLKSYTQNDAPEPLCTTEPSPAQSDSSVLVGTSHTARLLANA